MEKTEAAIKNEQSRETGNIGETRHMAETNNAKYTTHKTKKMSNTDLIWQLRYKCITDNINLVIDDLFTFVFLRVFLLGHGGASHDSFPVSTSSPLHGWPPYCGCGLLHALERVFVFNPFPHEAEHSPHSLHFVYVPHFPSTIP